MIGQQQLDRLMGTTVVDPEGDRIGTIDTVYVDDDTGEPTFAQVNTGLFGMKSSFVPLDQADLREDEVAIPYTKDKVKDAPKLEPEGHLEPNEEAELYSFYGLQYPAGGMHGDGGEMGRTDAPGTVGRDTSGPSTDDAMTRSEEELHVGTQRRETGRARLRKHIVTEHVTKTVPVQREEVRVEREPITDENVDEATSGPELSEEEHEVTLTEEEPVVEKRTVPKERVRLDKDTVTDQERVEDDVTAEQIEVDDAEARRRR